MDRRNKIKRTSILIYDQELKRKKNDEKEEEEDEDEELPKTDQTIIDLPLLTVRVNSRSTLPINFADGHASLPFLS